ncbi:MAG: cell division protein FtsZ [Nitrospira sp. SB0666_bin_27]|nr:cell division protein FtsZ [Nitrospira sp. SB0666_bin_27]MYC28318.1 cell division protein FtsZ [Nitrospira sp. SB0662_bin_26]MYF24334.1 cell division protein FtsZ [Nitrospira sp. SB0678_bin_10]
MFAFQEEEMTPIRIKVIGLGGAGCNAVNTMIAAGLTRVEFVVANTDLQSLSKSSTQYRIQLGPTRTKGLGAGANPEVGKESALESEDDIRAALEDADMVFVTAGMGGGTGTGGAPVAARLARDLGILTVGVVTKPFQHEGQRRMGYAEEGLRELRRHVDSLLVIPNQKLLTLVDKSTPVLEAFKVADDVLRQAIKGITDVITTPGLVNVDFADVKTVMSYRGRAVMGMGVARGANRAIEAVQQAMTSPLLEESGIEGAKGMLFNITGGTDLSLHELDEASTIAKEAADPQANIIVGHVIDPGLVDEVIITVIATGFEQQQDLLRTTSVANPVVQERPRLPVPPVPQPVLTMAGKASPDGSDDDLDRPAFMRRGELDSRIEQGDLLVDADWDVPTFLRRRAN